MSEINSAVATIVKSAESQGIDPVAFFAACILVGTPAAPEPAPKAKGKAKGKAAPKATSPADSPFKTAQLAYLQANLPNIADREDFFAKYDEVRNANKRAVDRKGKGRPPKWVAQAKATYAEWLAVYQASVNVGKVAQKAA